MSQVAQMNEHRVDATCSRTAAGGIDAMFGFAAIAIVVVLLAPVFIPIGANYWDLAIYVDAAHRISLGQVPNVDFRTPAGPLEYYLYALGQSLFAGGHPALIANWAYLVVTGPIFWVALRFNVQASSTVKYALALPFIFLALMPFNSSATFPAPGIDAYGYYNRHPALLLYVLVTLSVLGRPGRLLAFLTGLLLLCLLLTKITALVAALPIIGYLVVIRVFTLPMLAISALTLFVPLIFLEFATGIVGAYLANVVELLRLNTGGLLSRLNLVAATQFDTLIALFAIWVVLALVEIVKFPMQWKLSKIEWLTLFIKSRLVVFTLLLIVALVFELQNTGSQQYVFVWPFLVLLLQDWWRKRGWPRTFLVFAVAFATIPPVVSITHRAVRTLIATATYKAMPELHLGPLAHVSIRPAFLQRANVMDAHYAEHRQIYQQLADKGESPGIDISLEPDFQFLWLMKASQAVKAILDLEAERKIQIGSLLVLDFSDPVTAALKRDTPRHVQIGRDPDRTIAKLDARTLAELAATQGLLVPLCPALPFRMGILAKFEKALEGRTRVALTPCWDLYLRDPLASN
jgi:hypothetical protein